MARELMIVMGYVKWHNFHKPLKAAVENLELNGDEVINHITAVGNVVKRSQGGGSSQEDYKLSRYGCYMTALCCDGRKPEVASAKKYFATKTREAEVVIPAQDAELERLKIQLAIAIANNSTALTQERLLVTSQAIVAMHGTSMLALIQGRPGAVVTEKEVIRETVMVDQNLTPVATFNGMGIGEIARRLGFGTGKKATAQCQKWLKSVGITEEDWHQEMTAHATAKLPREMMPKLRELWALQKGDRQLVIGE